MKITRRALAVSALAGVAAAQPPSQPAPAADDLDQAARKQFETASQTLLHHELPMSVEPAFQFKA
jgi:hypothetical protein